MGKSLQTTPVEGGKGNSQLISQLSKCGSNCLSRQKRLDEKDVYEKQERKYDIVSMLPKTHSETIKKYPKLRLENSDENY